MDILKIKNVKIEGIVACLPEQLLENKIECADLFGNGVDTLIKATGINARTVANIGTTTLDLEVEAAEKLLKMTDSTPDEIGAIICVTFTPEYLMPSDAPSAQARLNVPTNSLAFDINLACSGYGYGLYIASTLVNALKKKVLLLNGDVQSAYVSKNDKSTFPIMSDIGTATLLSYEENNIEWSFSYFTDGSRRESLYIPSGGTKNPFKKEDLDYKEYDDGSKRRDIDIYMNGFEIFKFVAQDATKFIKEFMETISCKADDFDVFVPHQANIYMIGQLAKKLQFINEQVWKSGDEFGNPASASIPLTIAKNAADYFGRTKRNANILLSGFGGGLSISVANVILPSDGKYSVIKYIKGE